MTVFAVLNDMKDMDVLRVLATVAEVQLDRNNTDSFELITPIGTVVTVKIKKAKR